MMIQRSGGFLAGVSVDCKDAEELGHVGPPPTRGHRTEPCDLHSFSRQIMRARQKRKWRRARTGEPPLAGWIPILTLPVLVGYHCRVCVSLVPKYN